MIRVTIRKNPLFGNFDEFRLHAWRGEVSPGCPDFVANSTWQMLDEIQDWSNATGEDLDVYDHNGMLRETIYPGW